jgi:hypothetical protein
MPTTRAPRSFASWPGDGADAAAGGRHHDRLSRPRVEVVDTEVRADADVPQHTNERRGRRGQRRRQHGERRLQLGIVCHAVLLPAGEAHDDVADPHVGPAGGHRLAHPDAAHHRAVGTGGMKARR